MCERSLAKSRFGPFLTHARRKIGVIAIVGNDGAWMQIARDQSRLLGATTACELAYTNYQSVVEGFGGKGFLLTSLADVEPVLRQAKEIAARGIPVWYYHRESCLATLGSEHQLNVLHVMYC